MKSHSEVLGDLYDATSVIEETTNKVEHMLSRIEDDLKVVREGLGQQPEPETPASRAAAEAARSDPRVRA